MYCTGSERQLWPLRCTGGSVIPKKVWLRIGCPRHGFARNVEAFIWRGCSISYPSRSANEARALLDCCGGVFWSISIRIDISGRTVWPLRTCRLITLESEPFTGRRSDPLRGSQVPRAVYNEGPCFTGQRISFIGLFSKRPD